jgi:hypothetical protein
MFFVFVGVWLLFIPSSFVARMAGFIFLGVASLLRIDVLILNIVASITYLVLFVRKAVDMRAALLEPIREVSIHDEELATRRCSMMRIMAR